MARNLPDGWHTLTPRIFVRARGSVVTRLGAVEP